MTSSGDMTSQWRQKLPFFNPYRRKIANLRFFSLSISILLLIAYSNSGEKLLETHWMHLCYLKMTSSGDMTSQWRQKLPFFNPYRRKIANLRFFSLSISILLLIAYSNSGEKLLETHWMHLCYLKMTSSGDMSS